MLVCVCRGVSEHEVVEALRCGARTAEDVSRCCNDAGRDCGTCWIYLERLAGSRRFDERQA